MSINGRVLRAAVLIACASCSRPGGGGQTSSVREPMFVAFEAAFGKPAPYETIDDSGDHVVYRPQALVALKPGVVALISKREIPGGCKACAGGLAVNYLATGPDGFSRLGAWPN